MILVLGGTSESRQLIKKLAHRKYKLIVCTTTAYGGQLLDDTNGAVEIVTGKLNHQQLARLISEKKVTSLVDATHPFAELATANANKACKETNIKYIRFERPAMELPQHPLIIPVSGYEQAAAKAIEIADQTIFLTTGTKTLPVFTKPAYAAGLRVIARILPDLAGLQICQDLAIPPRDIIAMLGPFSKDMNKQLLMDYHADVLVTKESGLAGGSDTKIEAAMALSLPVVVVQRPPAPVKTINDLEKVLEIIDSYERMGGR